MAIGIAIGTPFGNKGISWVGYWASLISATVENAAPTNVVLTFPSAQTSLTNADFTIAGFTINSASWAGAVLTLVLAETVLYGDVLVVTFVITGGTANVTNNVALDANAATFITATGITSETEKAAVNELVIDLKAINATQANFVNFGTPASSICRAIYPFVGSTADTHKWNLIDPQDADGSFRIAWANDHAANHTVNGYKPNGTDQYGDTKFNPSTVLASVNSTHIAYYPTDATGNEYDMGCYTNVTTGFYVIARYDDLSYGISSNQTYPLLIPDFSGISFKIISRTANNAFAGFIDGVKLQTEYNTTVGAFPNKNFYIGIINGIAGYATKNYGFISIGNGITDAAAVLYDAAVYKFMLAMGRVSARVTPPASIRAGVAFTTDDIAINITDYITTNRLYLNSAYGYKWTAWIQDTVIDATEKANLLSMLAVGAEIGTHATIVAYRATHTPAETWTNVIKPIHDEIIAELSVTPVSFANHNETPTDDTDMWDYLETQGYVSFRPYGAVGLGQFYDGTNQRIAGYNYNNQESTWAAMKALIDDAFANDKILVVMTHTISATVNTLNITFALFIKAIAYVKYKNMTYYKMSELIPSLFA